MVKTPTIRPSKLQHKGQMNTSYGENANGAKKRDKEIKNLLSLWEAQKSARQMEKEVQQDIDNNEENKSESKDDNEENRFESKDDSQDSNVADE